MGMRRPLKTRETGWAKALAARVGAWGVRPNMISVFGVFIAAAGGVAFVLAPYGTPTQAALLLVGAAVAIQGRLLCNMLDGMVAVESGLGGPVGDLYNEFPDRLEDTILLAGAGYAVSWVAWAPAVGWLAASLALMTAYARALAGSMGVTQSFVGPMAKPHRMALLTSASLLSTLECVWGFRGRVLLLGLALICLGSVVTLWRRLRQAARELRDARR